MVALAIEKFRLPENLKLSVHSGSDKFAIYRPMHEALEEVRRRRAPEDGRHHLAGGTDRPGRGRRRRPGDRQGRVSRGVAGGSTSCAPRMRRWSTSIAAALPSPEAVAGWDGDAFAAALRHDAACEAYNPHLRQLLHVGYKVAAEMGDRFTAALERHAAVIAANVTQNLYERHIRPLFLGG